MAEIKTPIFSLWYLIAVIATVAIYSTGLSDFWLYDDEINLRDPWVAYGGDAPVEAIRSYTLGNWSGPLGRPVSMFTFALPALFTGEMNPTHIRVGNVFIHVLTGFFLYLFSRQVFMSLPGAWLTRLRPETIAVITAAVWLLHPLHVSTVLYSVQRMAQLSALFVVFGLWTFTKARAQWLDRAPKPHEVTGLVTWVLLSTLFAGLSKENGFLLPFLITVTEATLYGAKINGRRVRWLSISAWVFSLTPFILTGMIIATGGSWVTEWYDGRGFTLLERMLTQARVLVCYLRWLFFPDIRQMGFFHDEGVISAGWLEPLSTIFSIFLLIALVLISFFMKRKSPLPLFAILFFLIAHSLESGVVPLVMVFEHRNYLPSVAASILIAFTLAVLGRSLSKGAGLAFFSLTLIFLAAQLEIRAKTWSDPLIFAQTMAYNHPGSVLSAIYLGDKLLEERERVSSAGSPQERSAELLFRAHSEYKRAAQIGPQNIYSRAMLYIIYSQYADKHTNERVWLNQLLNIIESKDLSPDDLLSLKIVLKCAAVSHCTLSQKDEERILNACIQRSRLKSAGYFLVHDYLVSSGASAEERLDFLVGAASELGGTYAYHSRIAREYQVLDFNAYAVEHNISAVKADPSRLRLGDSDELFRALLAK